ncbi:MAG: hypothetical protein K2X77_01805 [Candidatus Obscuribacterales bacterium]|nr:hypothetical protein [Candidatus Obscuribacterales bacterium]
MAPLAYLLCALASIVCFAFLVRAYLRTRVRLLLWSTVCFFFLTVQNIVLFTDLVLVPSTDLSMYRMVSGLIGSFSLLFGLIWETRT